MRELSLFTGAGGGILGSKLLGWKTVGYVEWEPYCQRVIRQRIEDGIFDNAPIFGDIRSFNSEGYAESYKGMVDIVTGGFPCQPFSVAGNKIGSDDERNMWPETIRTIRTIRPKFSFFENVTGLLSSGYFGTILCNLHEMGYNVRWCVLSASDVGALQKRDRLWIFASNAMQIRRVNTNDETNKSEKSTEVKLWSKDQFFALLASEESQFKVQSEDQRMGDGLAFGMEQFGAIGNGQVPITMAAAFQILSEGII